MARLIQCADDARKVLRCADGERVQRCPSNCDLAGSIITLPPSLECGGPPNQAVWDFFLESSEAGLMDDPGVGLMFLWLEGDADRSDWYQVDQDGAERLIQTISKPIPFGDFTRLVHNLPQPFNESPCNWTLPFRSPFVVRLINHDDYANPVLHLRVRRKTGPTDLYAGASVLISRCLPWTRMPTVAEDLHVDESIELRNTPNNVVGNSTFCDAPPCGNYFGILPVGIGNGLQYRMKLDFQHGGRRQIRLCSVADDDDPQILQWVDGTTKRDQCTVVNDTLTRSESYNSSRAYWLEIWASGWNGNAPTSLATDDYVATVKEFKRQF